METSVTRGVEYSVERVLFLAFELGTKEWKLGFSTGLGQAPRIRSMPAADPGTLQEEIHLAKKRFGLPENARTLSCLPGVRQAMKLGGMASGWRGTWHKRGSRTWWWIPRASRLTEGIDGPKPIAWMRPNWSPC
jgi:hypothetical protein